MRRKEYRAARGSSSVYFRTKHKAAGESAGQGSLFMRLKHKQTRPPTSRAPWSGNAPEAYQRPPRGSEVVNEPGQLAASQRVLELSQCPDFDLTDPLP